LTSSNLKDRRTLKHALLHGKATLFAVSLAPVIGLNHATFEHAFFATQMRISL
jgi:uncharacterized circularly permuted ATP-grasp superfamily protein